MGDAEGEEERPPVEPSLGLRLPHRRSQRSHPLPLSLPPSSHRNCKQVAVYGWPSQRLRMSDAEAHLRLCPLSMSRVLWVLWAADGVSC